FHDSPASSRLLKIVFAAGALIHLLYPPPCLLVTKPCDVDAWKNDRLQNVCDGTAQNQLSNTANSRASVDRVGSISGANEPMITPASSGVGALPFLSRSKLMT